MTGRTTGRTQFFARPFTSLTLSQPAPPKANSARTRFVASTSSSSSSGLPNTLALNLSRLILAVCSAAKGGKVAAEPRAAYPGAVVEVWELEMGDYDSILTFMRRVEGLDIVILNAGMATTEFALNKKTGHCQVVQVNYLSTFLLAILLLPVLRDREGKAPGRLTIVGSGAVFAAGLPNRGKRPFLKSFDDLAVQGWDASERYFSSKVLGMLFFVRLFEHLPPAEEVVVNIVDPGFCKGTQLHREARGLMSAVMSTAKALTGRSLEDGAWTYIDAAVVQGKESHGCFVMDWGISGFYYAVYEPQGPELMDALFEETMAELEFAGVREILGGLRKQ
ncbi:hypothetical protein C8A00DRAFT_47714 [Chaetomidium leptoderma]|uniref:Uncharacterized protein n=1 Tax=Chaetomidium leptoderma TaxID=669021 RepID=A0AAN6VBL2_9PEZI|nr:hypothetical protein C8A00DRAFT_47714 [Chaetomidium leptoderma]